MSETQISSVPKAQKIAATKKPFVLFRIIQWAIVALFALIALILVSDIGRLSTPGAPVAAFWVALAVVTAVAAVHSPPLFFRLPNKLKLFAYICIIVAVGVFGDYGRQMQAAYSKTPQGAKEAAAEAAADRQAANERAAEAARLKAAEEARESDLANKKLADLEAQKPGICKILVDQMIAQTKSAGVQIIEVNNVTVEPGVDEIHPVSCSGDAITSRGSVRVEFGLEHTPQGKDLLSFRFP